MDFKQHTSIVRPVIHIFGTDFLASGEYNNVIYIWDYKFFIYYFIFHHNNI